MLMPWLYACMPWLSPGIFARLCPGLARHSLPTFARFARALPWLAKLCQGWGPGNRACLPAHSQGAHCPMPALLGGDGGYPTSAHPYPGSPGGARGVHPSTPFRSNVLCPSFGRQR